MPIVLSNVFYTNGSVFLDINVDAENHINLVAHDKFKNPKDFINSEDLEISQLFQTDIIPACKDSNFL